MVSANRCCIFLNVVGKNWLSMQFYNQYFPSFHYLLICEFFLLRENSVDVNLCFYQKDV